MKKSNKTPKKMSAGTKTVAVIGALALVGAGVGIASIGGNQTGEVVVNVESDATLKAPLQVIASDFESGATIVEEVYAISESGKSFSFNTSTEFADTMIAGKEYSIYLLDSNAYGSSVVLSDNDRSGAVIGADGGVVFTLGDEGTDLKLEVNLISDYMLKAEDEVNGVELFVGTSDAYTDVDTIQFDGNASGGVMTVDDEFQVTTFLKPNIKDAVANDNGMLVVIDTSNDEWEDLAVSFAGKGLTEIDSSDLKDMFADVNYDNFRTSKVFMIDKDVVMTRNSEYELGISATLIDGATISEDITANIYTLGYILTADGRELTALDSAGNPLHAAVDKAITFNLA